MIRVLYNHGTPRFVLGPLGLYERGQRLEIEGREVLVVNVDHDGAGVAFETDYIQLKADEANMRFDEMIASKFCRYRTGLNIELNDSQQEKMTKTIMFNRRQAGLDETDPREEKIAF